jgi:hypothetical protein
LGGQFAEPSKDWPPQHPGGYQSLKYFGIEVPTLVHPLDNSSGETFINDFGSQYNLDARVIRYLLENEGVDCLERFRFAYSENFDYRGLVLAAQVWCQQGVIPRVTAQAADLKRAWTEVTSCYRRRVKEVEEPPPEADLDTPIPGNALAAARVRFFDMYRYTPEDSQIPGDRMQSRIMRELKSKATKPFDLAKVTTIEDEADNERVQKQLGNGLHFTMEHAKPKKRALRTVAEYLDALWVLMLALAIAGSDRVMPRPVNKDGSLRIEMPTDNPHDFTVIPLSLLKKYFDRCQKNSSKVHDRDALFWLKDRDGEERATWAKFFRESEGLTFGFVINKIWHMRVACWDPHIGSRRSAPATLVPARAVRQQRTAKPKRRSAAPGQQVTLRPNPKTTAARKTKKKGKGQGKGGGEKRAPTMRSGEKICAAWNEGKCTVKGDSCDAGKHVCNAITDKNKRACAMRNHMGKDCTKAVRA